MSTTSEAIVNHSLFEENQDDQMHTQMGFLPFPANLNLPFGCHQSLKAFSAITSPSLASEAASAATNLAETLLVSAAQKQREDLTSFLGAAQLLSLERSRANPWYNLSYLIMLISFINYTPI